MRRLSALLVLLAISGFASDSIVLVTLDTVRADRLSLYGYAPKTSPSLDAAAAKGMVFDQAYSIVPLTFPAHVAMLTGKTPFDTGLFLNGQKFTPEDGYLPTVLKKKGYATAAFLSSAILERTFGTAKDFDTYDDTMTKKALGEEVSERSGAETVAKALAWLKTAKKPFFLWVHLFDPHAPYRPDKPWAGRFAHPYDAEIAQMDAALGDLLKNLPARTSILIAGDHGEMLGEHGEDEHGVLLYQPAIHVPLVLLGPGTRTGRVARPVTLLDIYPTLLTLAGAPVPAGLQGGDLRGLPTGERSVLASSLYGREVLGFHPSLALIDGGFKLIAYGDRDYKLFDLAADPAEADNLFMTDRRRVREMRKVLQGVEFPATLQVAIRDEDKKKLTALGYSTPKKVERLILPEEGLKYERMLVQARKALDAGENERAETLLQDVLAAAPTMTEARTLLGKLYMKQNRHAEAREVFAGLTNQEAADPRTHLEFARTLAARQEFDKAEQELTVALALDPRLTEAYDMLARLYLGRRDFAALEGLKARAAQNSVESAPLFAALGVKAGEEKDADAAERNYREALEVDPGAFLALKGLGGILHARKQYQEAFDLFVRALQTVPREPECNYMAGVLAFQLRGDKQEALPYLRRAAERCGPSPFCERVREAIARVER